MRTGTGQRWPQFKGGGLQHSAIYWWQTDMYAHAHYTRGIYLKAFPLNPKIKTDAFSAMYRNIHKYTCVRLFSPFGENNWSLKSIVHPKIKILPLLTLNKHAIFSVKNQRSYSLIIPTEFQILWSRFKNDLTWQHLNPLKKKNIQVWNKNICSK